MFKVICDGRLTRAAELRIMDDGNSVLNFTVATDVLLGKGEKVTEYIECSMWGNHVINLSQYLTKGLQVFVVGDGSLRSWNQGSKSGVNIRCRVDSVTLGAAPGAGKVSEEQAGAPAAPASNNSPDITDDDLPY